jgi:alkanesulfonate monooxygenase SsuD/methylene tetrahydromethanopterin reductase-like flavin-dependent oxidoreductase (luciferase family)
MGLAVVGNPEHVTERLAALQASGLDRVNLMIGGGDLSAAEAVDCLHLLAERVLPAHESSAAEAAPA